MLVGVENEGRRGGGLEREKEEVGCEEGIG